MALLFVETLLGLAILIAGNELFLRGFISTGRAPQAYGALAASFSVGLPKLISIMQSGSGGSPDLAAGTIIGTAGVNMGLLLGVAALAGKLRLGEWIRRDAWLLAGGGLLLTACCLDQEISRLEGLILLLGFCAYGVYLLRTAEHRPGAGFIGAKATPCRWCAAAYLPTGLALLFTGSDILVDGASACAHALHRPEEAIGLTLLAFCTSLPLLGLTLSAIRRGQQEEMAAALLSNTLFVVLGVSGVSALLVPLPVSPTLLGLPLIGMAGFCVLPLIAMGGLGRATGITGIALYLAYAIVAYFLH